MSFVMLPPEINSARMYSGPGAEPLLQAATSWGVLAAELHTTGAAIAQVVAGLGAAWQGPSAAAMTTSVMSYVGWIDATAVLAGQTANQAAAAAAAFESAFAGTVPPPVVAENRVRLAALVATNFLGINTPAIMATEAQYAEMWAQDVAAMFGYQAGSAQATQLAPFMPPASTVTDVLAAPIQSVEGTAQSVLSAMNLLDPTSLLNVYGAALLSSGFWFAAPEGVVQSLTSMVALYSLVQGQKQIDIATGNFPSIPPEPAPTVGMSLTPSGLSAAATYGGAPQVGGRLSVPASWPGANPSINNERISPLNSGESNFTGIPGVPILGSQAKKDSEPARYGFRRTKVIPRHPSAG